jgi:hypothetical protein
VLASGRTRVRIPSRHTVHLHVTRALPRVTNPYAGAANIDGTSYTGIKINMNGVTPTTPHLLQNQYPTAITLFNVYNTSTVRASVGGFLNWICDSNTNFNKGLDNTTGQNFDSELTTTISSVFGFPRLTDTSPEPAIATPADGVPAPNNSCAASLPVTTTSGSNQITLASGTFPPDIVNAGAWSVAATSPSPAATFHPGPQWCRVRGPPR